MIKLIYAKYIRDFQLELEFSDGVRGIFDLAGYLKENQGSLLEPLKNEAYAKRCFIDAGALCWPNGLGLSPARLHEPQHLKSVA